MSSIFRTLSHFYAALAVVFLLMVPKVATATEALLKNPLTPDRTDTLAVSQLVGIFIRGVLSITGVVALVMIIWAGVQIAFSLRGGKEGKLIKGKQTLLYAIVGLIISFGGYVIVNVIIQTLQPGQ